MTVDGVQWRNGGFAMKGEGVGDSTWVCLFKKASIDSEKKSILVFAHRTSHIPHRTSHASHALRTGGMKGSIEKLVYFRDAWKSSKYVIKSQEYRLQHESKSMDVSALLGCQRWCNRQNPFPSFTWKQRSVTASWTSGALFWAGMWAAKML